MKYSLITTKRFEKNLVKIIKSSNIKNIKNEIYTVIESLQVGEILDLKYRDHKLQGEYKEYRECHVKPNVLFLYKIDNKELILIAVDIGSHSYLF